jgi:hypothetical protein
MTEILDVPVDAPEPTAEPGERLWIIKIIHRKFKKFHPNLRRQHQKRRAVPQGSSKQTEAQAHTFTLSRASETPQDCRALLQPSANESHRSAARPSQATDGSAPYHEEGEVRWVGVEILR